MNLRMNLKIATIIYNLTFLNLSNTSSARHRRLREYGRTARPRTGDNAAIGTELLSGDGADNKPPARVVQRNETVRRRVRV